MKVNKNIRTERQARRLIADLLLEFSGAAASGRLEDDARFAKQSVRETANRTATNILRNFVVRKPGGAVYDY